MKFAVHRILVALDRTDGTNQVLDAAIALAHQNNSHLVLMHGISTKVLEQLPTLIDAGFGLVSSAKMRQLQDDHLNEVNQAWQWLWDCSKRVQAQGLTTEIICMTGTPGFLICQLAEQWGTDLIVIGHGGKPTLKTRIFGNTTLYVAQHSSCSILIVQPIVRSQPLAGATPPDASAFQLLYHPSANTRWNVSLPMA